MTALEFSGTVTGGRLPKEMAERIAVVVRSMDGKRLTIAVKEEKKRRTLKANAYLWSGVYPPIVAAFREHGNLVDAEDVHIYCKIHVGKLKQVLVTPDGEVLHSVGSTRHLSTKEFGEYVEAVRVWALAVLGVEIPDAREAA